MHYDSDNVTTNLENLSFQTPVPASRDATDQASQTPLPDVIVDLRLRRIKEYLHAALQSPVAEVAMLAGVNADFATLELRLHQSIEATLQECRNRGEYADAVPDAVAMMLKVARQLERGTRLASELARSQGKS